MARGPQRHAIIDRTHALPITREAAVLRISRSGIYYTPASPSDADLAPMRRLDALHLEMSHAHGRAGLRRDNIFA